MSYAAPALPPDHQTHPRWLLPLLTAGIVLLVIASNLGNMVWADWVQSRPLGLIAAQLSAAAGWAARHGSRSAVRLTSTGRRNQVAALVAASIEPALFEKVEVREGMASLQEVLDKPVEYAAAPELFCLDLYRDFDLPRLVELSRGAGGAISSPVNAR